LSAGGYSDIASTLAETIAALNTHTHSCVVCNACQSCDTCENCDTCLSCDTCQTQCEICEFCDLSCTSDYSEGQYWN
jgi:hypothetical protein